MTVKETLAQLKVDLKSMTFREKVGHIWDNFKEYILIATVFVLLAGSYIVSLLTAKDLVLGGYMVNVTVTEEGKSYICQDFLPSIGDPAKEEITLTPGDYSKEPDITQYEMNNASFAQIAGMMELNELDFMITDTAGLELCLSMELYLGLDEFFTEEELAALEGRLMFVQEEGSSVRQPVCVDISDTDFAKEHLSAKGKIYIGFIGKTTRLESCRSLYDYIINYQTDPASP